MLESLARKYILLCFSMRGFGSPTGLHGGSVGSTKFLSSFLSRELEERGMLEKLDVFLRSALHLLSLIVFPVVQFFVLCISH